MTQHSSTIRSVNDPTIGDSLVESPQLKLLKAIRDDWSRSGRPDLVDAIERHPQLLRDRSILLDLAIQEFRFVRGRSSNVELENHCQRFCRFGNSIEKSIYRQLETQMYLDDHPELLDLLAEPVWPSPGEEFEGFLVLEELGRGGMARVYLCQQDDVGNRRVVVKVTPSLGYEASILGRLNHPHIVPIYSTGAMDERGLNYLCMPYLGRSTLTDLIDMTYAGDPSPGTNLFAEAANRWIPSEELSNESARRRSLTWHVDSTYVGGVLSLAVKIADALAHAHARNILHGDLKPSNVLLTPAAEPLLMDFNLSQDHTDAIGLRGGTLPYMPPEHLAQVAGQNVRQASFDPKSDIYSFGALLYELLTGVSPVTVPRELDDLPAVADALHRQLQAGIPPVRQFNSSVGQGLDLIVRRCLSMSPNQRPASMTEVKRALEKHTRWPARIRRTADARPRTSLAALGLALLLTAAAAAYYALRPPWHVTQFERGLERLAAEDHAAASEYFRAAIRSNPEFRPARFQLARNYVALGDLDQAIAEFRTLARDDDDLLSSAYVGYCFNLKRIPVAAIPWYEGAVGKGAESAAVYNNLGASYLATSAHLSNEDRFARAEFLLRRAHELVDSSGVIRLNLLRLEMVKGKRDPAYLPLAAWPHVEALSEQAKHESIVRAELREWYRLVLPQFSQIGPFGLSIPDSNLLWDRLLDSGDTAPQSATAAAKVYYIAPDAPLDTQSN